MVLEYMAVAYGESAAKLAGSRILGALLAKRAEAARDILVDRLQKAKATLKDIPEEEAAAITYRYMRAAEEGAARINLKLLADVIVGQDAKPGFFANDFLLWAEVISSLRHEEIVMLGIMHREAAKLDYKLKATGDFWAGCLAALEKERGLSAQTCDRIGAKLLRTGLVTILGGLMGMGHAYMPTTDLQKLAEISDLEAYYMEEPYVA